jgi:transcriptional regulator of heat shock response
MTTKIHVNQHHIRSNITKGTDLSVITIKQGRKNTYCNEIEILGPSKLIYSGTGCDTKPLLSCGARVVIETESEIKIIR